MTKPAIMRAPHHSCSMWFTSTIVFFSFILIFGCSPLAAETPLSPNKGRFLVATEQLNDTSFQQAVILITHLSERGATGLTINRPTDIPLSKIFPHTQQFKTTDDSLYLGGPVSTNAIFVLLRTRQPNQNMHHIAKNIYFSTADNAFSNPFHESTRVYAGYTGWHPGQLQIEIDRGDWILVHQEPDIIFEKNPHDLWQRLLKRWSGLWI